MIWVIIFGVLLLASLREIEKEIRRVRYILEENLNRENNNQDGNRCE